MAREKKSIVIAFRVELKDYWKLCQYYEKLAPAFRGMIKKLIYEKEKADQK